MSRRLSGFFLICAINVVDLVDARAVAAAPVAPLRAVNAAEISVFVGPFVPNRDAVFVEIFDVGVAAQKPEQLVNDRLDVQLLGGEQRKSRTVRPQIEPRLRAEDRKRARAGAIVARLTFFQERAGEDRDIAAPEKVRVHDDFAKRISSAGLWRQPSPAALLKLQARRLPLQV